MASRQHLRKHPTKGFPPIPFPADVDAAAVRPGDKQAEAVVSKPVPLVGNDATNLLPEQSQIRAGMESLIGQDKPGGVERDGKLQGRLPRSRATWRQQPEEEQQRYRHRDGEND